MARRRKSSGGAGRGLAVLAVLAAVGAGAWYVARHRHVDWSGLLPSTRHSAAVNPAANNASGVVAASASHVDPANEGRRVRVEGSLRVARPARDADLGVQADALVLLRSVQMRQWRETCSANACEYALAWSDRPVDSQAFRVAAGHANTTPFPFSNQRFPAAEARLGAYVVEPVAALAQGTPTPLAVDLSQLPPNLAASFRAEEGALLTGDAAHPAQGDLRVRYATIAAGPRALTGVQRGGKLVLDH